MSTLVLLDLVVAEVDVDSRILGHLAAATEQTHFVQVKGVWVI